MLKMKVNGKWDFVSSPDVKAKEEMNSIFDISELKPGIFHIISGTKSFHAEFLETNTDKKNFVFLVNGNRYTVEVRDKYDELLHQLGMDKGSSSAAKDLKAPMPGMVIEIKVKEGDHISKGSSILVLEAMKMENILKSPGDGIVKKILVLKGQKVEKNQLLITLQE